MVFQAHPTALVDPGSEIGDNTKIWHFSHVREGARIGKDVSLGQNVYVGSDTLIGDRCKIQNNVSIYDGVTFESDVFCGPSVVFTNVFNPRAFVCRKSEYRRTLIKQGASLGANSTIVCGVTIGDYALVGAGAVVNKNIKAYGLVVGVPARQIGWVTMHGERLPFPLRGESMYICPISNLRYTLNDDQISID